MSPALLSNHIHAQHSMCVVCSNSSCSDEQRSGDLKVLEIRFSVIIHWSWPSGYEKQTNMSGVTFTCCHLSQWMFVGNLVVAALGLLRLTIKPFFPDSKDSELFCSKFSLTFRSTFSNFCTVHIFQVIKTHKSNHTTYKKTHVVTHWVRA